MNGGRLRMEVWRCSHSAARQVILVIFSDPNFVFNIRLSKIFMSVHLSKKEATVWVAGKENHNDYTQVTKSYSVSCLIEGHRQGDPGTNDRCLDLFPWKPNMRVLCPPTHSK